MIKQMLSRNTDAETQFGLTKSESSQQVEIETDTKKASHRESIIKILLVVVFGTATLNYGIGMGYSAVLLPQLQHSNGSLHTDEEMGSWIASTPAIAALMGALFGGILMDCIGRKLTLQFQTVVIALEWIVIASCQNHFLLLLGRFIGGFGSGVGLVVAPIYIAEITDPNSRGMLSVIPAFSQAFGILLVYILGSTLHWRLVAGLSIIPTIISIFTSFILPESPVWLVRHGHTEKARKACIWYRANNIIQGQQEVQQIINRAENEKHQQHGSQFNISSFCTPQILKPFIIVNMFSILQTLAGWLQFILYAVEIISLIVEGNINEYITAVLTAGVRLVFTVAAVFALAFLGRRTIGIYANLCTGVSAFTLGIFLFYNQKTNGYFPAACLFLYVAGATIGFPTLGKVMMGELFPARVRAAVGSITTVIASLLMFGFTKLFPLLNNLLGIHGLFMLFGIASVLASIWIYFTLPETKGKTLNEIEDYFLQDNVLWTTRNKKSKYTSSTVDSTSEMLQ